jgi:hypothetical protein
LAKRKTVKKAVEPTFPETLFVQREEDRDDVYYTTSLGVPSADGQRVAIYTLDGVYTVKTTVELE